MTFLYVYWRNLFVGIRVIYFVDPIDFNISLPSIFDLEELTNEIKINPKNTSSYQRSLKSQHDPRTSSIAIGVSGLLIVLGICGYICSLDLISHIRVNGKVKITQGLQKQDPNIVAKNGSSDKCAKKGGRKNYPESVDSVDHIYAWGREKSIKMSIINITLFN